MSLNINLPVISRNEFALISNFMGYDFPKSYDLYLIQMSKWRNYYQTSEYTVHFRHVNSSDLKAYYESDRWRLNDLNLIWSFMNSKDRCK